MGGVAGVGNKENAQAPTRAGLATVPDSLNEQAVYTDSFVLRRVPVTGTGGVAATVIVTAQRGQVWVSIQPPFTWEAIMEPGKVDELIRVLAQAREAATKMRREWPTTSPRRSLEMGSRCTELAGDGPGGSS